MRRIHNDPKIFFQIMTRSASASDVVRRGIQSIHSSCKEIAYSEYCICVVTEDPHDVSYVGDQAQVLVVPQTFATQNGAVRKARALHYAVEKRREARTNITPNNWVFHLDEESVVTRQTLLSLLAFVRARAGLLSEGPIVYPMKIEEANKVTMLAESVRPFQCYDCVSHMTHPPPLYMHGSNLFVRADVEDAVGWDHGETLAEDQLFGIRVYEKYGPVFGWHGGVLLEQPPLTLRDHFKQRRRWVFGTLQNLKYLGTRMKLRIYLRASTYWLGFASAIASAAMYLYYFSPTVVAFFSHSLGMKYAGPSIAGLPIATPQSIVASLRYGQSLVITWQSALSFSLGACLMFAFCIWIVSYQIGLYQNLRYSRLKMAKRVALHLQQLVLSPLIGIIETFPAFYAVIEFYIFKSRRMDFEVIAK